ncbi:MAG TPA: hypothetical protein VM869_20415 [Enhygromyxa sp.]|nr:hypothetical protein [Enhygromyxa sp.]
MASGSGSSTRWLGVVSTFGLGSACYTPCSLPFDPLPVPDADASAAPQVLAGEWIGPGVLELSFSKPLRADGDIDPNRFTLITWDAEWFGGSDECYPGTNYSELRPGAYYYYPPAGISAVWIGPEDDMRLRLRLSSSAMQCRSSSDAVASGLILVYTNADDPGLGVGLRDENGVALPDLGPAWAITALDECIGNNYCWYFYESTSGHLPEFDSLAPIPCP